MSDNAEVLTALQEALAFSDTSIIVRTEGAVAEIRGPLTLRRGPEWLTLGQDDSSHVHVKTGHIQEVRFRDPSDSGAVLEVLGKGGRLLCKVCFRRTNPARPNAYDLERVEHLRARFLHLSEREET